MKLTGQMRIGDEHFVLFVNYTRSLETYYCFASIKTSDYLNLQDGTAITVIQSVRDLYNVNAEEYLIGALKRSRVTGKIEASKNTGQIELFLNAMQEANRYQFPEDRIFLQDVSSDLGLTVEQFGAEDDQLSFLWVKESGIYTNIKLRRGAINLELKRTMLKNPVRDVKFKEVTQAERKIISRATVEKVTLDTLKERLDMSWYCDEDGLKKDYRSVKTIQEFETVFGEMCHAMSESSIFYVSLDTETTGLNIYNLSKTNEDRDHCVAIPLSWEDDKAFVIFTDMQEFQSIPNEYAWGRLQEVFGEHSDGNVVEFVYGGERSKFTVERSKINLIGHNCAFDRRVGLGEGYDVWFDDDTLQMGFCINPTTVRGSKKLKMLTRILFGHETPELEDVLGRGNEDKYRYLVDEEVARIYGCADADYTRKCFFVLKRMLGEKMYFRYKKQDVKMINILAASEFYGLNTEAEEVTRLGSQVFANIEILEDATYRYVGSYMDYNQKASILQSQFDTGMLTEDQFLRELESIEVDENARYEFKLSGAGLREVLYDVLKYPITLVTDSGLPKVDKAVRNKLLKEKRKEDSKAKKLNRSILAAGCDYSEYERLCNGNAADKRKAKSMVLVDKDEFNSLEYPLALLLKVYAEYQKEYTAYYKPMRETNLEGKLFKSYSLARIETRRIMNSLQTIKKDLKQFVLPYSDDYYLLDFDMSQVEYRAMASLAGAKELVDKMKDCEKDYHIETAAMINSIAPYLVTKYQRKSAKNVSFGKPYGLGLRSLTEIMHGAVNDNTLFETRMTLGKWEEANREIVDYLESNRDAALEELELPLEKRNFMDAWQRDPKTKEYLLDENGEKLPKPLGAVYNRLGFCRYFDLSDVPRDEQADLRRKMKKYNEAEGIIRRAAGNYPVQSFAAELFRTILYRFYDRCEAEGIQDKIIWHMLIHDELLCSVHKSINPFFIYKIVKEACMITMAEHTNYFIGINVGNTWEECKDDAREAPVHFVEEMIEKWDAGDVPLQEWYDDPWEYVKPFRERYVSNRIHSCIKSILPGIDEGAIDMAEVFEKFDNYTVRAYVNDYPENGPITSGLSQEDAEDERYVKRFESWVLEYYGEGKEIIGLDGRQYAVSRWSEDDSATVDEFVDFDGSDDFEDFDEELFVEESEMYDLESGALVENFLSDNDVFVDDDDDGIKFDYEVKGCTNVAQMEIVAKKYENLKTLGGCLIISVDNVVQAAYLKSVIKTCRSGGSVAMFKIGNGLPVRWQKVSTSEDLYALDRSISYIRALPKSAKVLQDRMIFETADADSVAKIRNFVRSASGSGYRVFVKPPRGDMISIGSVRADADFSSIA